MKVAKHFALVFVLLVLAAMESAAQTSSSASQTVTFGIMRSSVVAARVESASIAVTESSAERATPLKIAVGSDARSNLVVDGLDKKSSRSRLFAYNIVSSASRSSAIPQTAFPPAMQRTGESLSNDRFVVTLTE